MTVAEYVMAFLTRMGISTIYMVSGSSAMWLTDAVYRNDALEAVCCNHEQAAAMAAACYGRSMGIPGACLVTVGPGAMNAMTGVAGAFVDSFPMIVISGETNAKNVKRHRESMIRQAGTQSLNLEPIITPIVKYSATILNPPDIRYHMERACHEASSGRQGPVWINIPVDMQNRQIPTESDMKPYIPEEKRDDPVHMDEITALLHHARRPLILAGYGVVSAKATDLLLRLSQTHEVPVVTSRNAIDAISTDNPLFVGRPGSYGDRASHFAIRYCDFLLILGCRLSASTVGYYPNRFACDAVKVMVDIDQTELDLTDVPIDHKFRCDIRSFLSLMLEQQPTGDKPDRTPWISYNRENKEKYPVVEPSYALENPINSYHFTSRLSSHAPDKAILVVDTGSVCNIVSQAWCLKNGQQFIISGGLSSMGFWAGAIGAAASRRKVLALTGDGSAQMNIQELATIKYNRLPIKLFVFNNHGYLLIRHNQHNYMNDRFLGVGPDSGVMTPDFCAVASAYGLRTVRIDALDSMEARIKEALDGDDPVLCEVMTQSFGTIAPRIASKVMPDGTLKAADFEDLWPFLDDSEYRGPQA